MSLPKHISNIVNPFIKNYALSTGLHTGKTISLNTGNPELAQELHNKVSRYGWSVLTQDEVIRTYVNNTFKNNAINLPYIKEHYPSLRIDELINGEYGKDYFWDDVLHLLAIQMKDQNIGLMPFQIANELGVKWIYSDPNQELEYIRKDEVSRYCVMYLQRHYPKLNFSNCRPDDYEEHPEPHAKADCSSTLEESPF